MVKIIATNAFSRWMKRAGIRDVDLLGAVAEMSRGLIDANLGGDVYKKRFGVAGRGKRGGARTIVATRRATAGSSCSASKRTSAPTSAPRN